MSGVAQDVIKYRSPLNKGMGFTEFCDMIIQTAKLNVERKSRNFLPKREGSYKNAEPSFVYTPPVKRHKGV